MKSMSDNFISKTFTFLGNAEGGLEKAVKLVIFTGVAAAVGYVIYYLWKCASKHGGKLNMITISQCLGGSALDTVGDLAKETGKAVKESYKDFCKEKKKPRSGWDKFTNFIEKISPAGGVKNTCKQRIGHITDSSKFTKLLGNAAKDAGKAFGKIGTVFGIGHHEKSNTKKVSLIQFIDNRQRLLGQPSIAAMAKERNKEGVDDMGKKPVWGIWA